MGSHLVRWYQKNKNKNKNNTRNNSNNFLV